MLIASIDRSRPRFVPLHKISMTIPFASSGPTSGGGVTLLLAAAADGGIVSEIMSKHGRSAQPESQQLVAVTRAVCEVVTQEGLQV